MKVIFRRTIAACLLCLACTGSALAATYRLPFSDTSTSENSNEIITMYDLGLLEGYADGTFRPDGTITRAEACKLVMLICTDQAPSDAASSYRDVEAGNWAASYIAWCTEQGIISGDGDGFFRPDDTITGTELARMLLAAIKAGGDYTGADWKTAVERDAQTYRLFNGFYTSHDAPLTRQGACQLVFNALHCYAVQEVLEDGTVVYVTDDLLNPITILEARFGIVRYSELIEANEYADLTEDGARLENGTTRLAQHRALPVYTDLSYLGRVADIYVQDGKVIGLPCLTANEVYTTVPMDTYQKMAQAGGYTLAEDVSYYIDYDAATASELEALSSLAEVTMVDHEGDGKFDLIMAVDWQSATVTSISPLVLQLDSGEEYLPEAYRITRSLAVGDKIQFADIGGQILI